MKKIDEFWRPKGRASSCIEIQGHMAIIASRSKLLREKFLQLLGERKEEER